MKTKTPQTSERDPDAKKIVVVNRKARHEYSILEVFDAGLALVGTEVKSIRNGRANIQDAFAKIEGSEVWVHNLHISPYDHGTRWNVDPRRARKLLLHRREITILKSHLDQKGLTLVPLALYFQRGFAKLELGLGRGKKLYDKRDDIAARDVEREKRRELAAAE